jgi:hypothetical protein
MAGYSGKMTLNFWSEGVSTKEVENKLEAMLDQWNLATDRDIQWDDVDWTIQKEKDSMPDEDTCEYCSRIIWLWSDKMWHDSDDNVDCSLATGYGCHFPLSQAIKKETN